MYRINLQKVEERLATWKECLPDVIPYFAVKSNPHPAIISTLAREGCNFDCASPAEIELVLRYATPDRILYANCIKSREAIRWSCAHGVKFFTFDCQEEYQKIMQLCPDAALLLRLRSDSQEGALHPLSDKFGVTRRQTTNLIDLPGVVGFSFHVGTRCYSPAAYRENINLCRELWRPHFTVLDLGGGFSSTQDLPDTDFRISATKEMDFQATAKVIRENIGFAAYTIAEPGRFLVESSCIITANVIGVKGRNYYFDNGVYQDLSCLLTDNCFLESNYPERVGPATLYGPTCDSLDCLAKDIACPRLFVDDKITIGRAGAYTNSLQTQFNGFPSATKYVDR